MPSAPKAPDPRETAAAQGQMNRDTAITQFVLGASNQKTPFGSMNFSQSGWYDPTRGYVGMDAAGEGVDTSSWTPTFNAEQTLNPQLQGIYDNFMGAGNALSGNLKDTLSKPVSMAGLPARVNSLGLRDVGTQLGLQTSFGGGGKILSRYGGDNPIQMSVGPENYSEDRQRVEEALLSRINPQLDRDRSRTEADLRARGIAPGSGRAYDRSMDELNRQATDARYGAILAGGQEQSRLAGLDLAQGQFANAAQQQAYGQAAERAQFANLAQQMGYDQALGRATFANGATSANADFERSGIGINNNNQLTAANFKNNARAAGLEELFAARSAPINEISALLSGTQLAGPKFTSTPQPGVNGVDYAGLVNQEYQAKLQANQGMWGGIGGIGSALIGMLPFSDRRLKRDIHRIGRLANGLAVYAYEKFGLREIGLMADEVKRIRPFAVKRHTSGYDVVDYAEAVI